jgi:hypothetical protein
MRGGRCEIRNEEGGVSDELRWHHIDSTAYYVKKFHNGVGIDHSSINLLLVVTLIFIPIFIQIFIFIFIFILISVSLVLFD